jgi:CheY-like chemotaxis protein
LAAARRRSTKLASADNLSHTSAQKKQAAREANVLRVAWCHAPGYPGLDLLVTDLMMPGINGRELAMITRRRFPNTRVLYVTGFAGVQGSG